MTKEIRRLPGPKQVIRRAAKPAKPARPLGPKTVVKPPTTGDGLYGRIATLIARVRLEQQNIVTPDEQRRAWVEPIRKYAERQLKGRGGGQRAYEVVAWYSEHWQDSPYIPVVHSATALRQKFERLEQAMQRYAPATNGHDLTAVLQQNGIAAALADDFANDIVRLAKGLNLTDIGNDHALAAPLAALYAAVKQARADAGLSTDLKLRLGTPYEVVCRYLDWLEDQGWRSATSRVLQFGGSAFTRFRRQVEDAEGLDPVDGGQS